METASTSSEFCGHHLNFDSPVVCRVDDFVRRKSYALPLLLLLSIFLIIPPVFFVHVALWITTNGHH